MQSALVLLYGIAILTILVTPVAAQAVGQQPMNEADQNAWPAVGQISYGGPVGDAICTGTLVAPDLVLTAGHCVAVDGVVMQADRVQFAAGWRSGASRAVRHGSQIILAQPLAGQPRSLSQDVALIVLDAPIVAAGVTPLPLLRQDLFSETYDVLAYRRDAPGTLQKTEGCALVGTTPGLLTLGCAVVSGNSGAPVLRWRKGIWHLAGVMAASAGVGGSIAVIPGDDLRDRIARH